MSKFSICSTILLALLVMLPSAYAVELGAEFRCKDPFVRDGSRASLIKAFGAANVVREDIFLAGDTVPMTVIFPKNPRRRLEIVWRDMRTERGISKIIIESMWSVSGITIGASIVDVEKVNGRP